MDRVGGSMKLKEFFYKFGLRPNYKFFPSIKTVIGEHNNKSVEFYQWREPKAQDLKLHTDEIAELSSFIQEGDTAIDVGAHIGDSTLPIALACGAKGKVFAFEPNPIVFATLAKNAAINTELTQIVPIPFACTDDDVDMVFKYSEASMSNGGDKTNAGFRDGHTFPMPVNGLNPLSFLQDRYAQDLEKLRYIKIDVEGLDYLVLKQFEALIDQHSPYIKFEIAKFTSHDMRMALQSYFKNKPYKFYRVDEAQSKLAGFEADAEIFFYPTHCDVFCVPE